MSPRPTSARSSAGAEVQIGATMLGEDTVTGTITNVADFVDPQTRTVKVRGTIENPGPRA